MNCVEQAFELRSRGKFIEALRALDGRKENGGDRQAAEALRADLLEQVGRHIHARASAESLLRSKLLPPSLRSACELVLARLDRENGNLPSAIQRLE